MHTFFIKTAAWLGALAVLAGAFGAHALKQSLNDKYQAVYETAVRYHFYHVFALVAVGILFKEFPNTWLLWAGRFFCYGILLFSGSLYLMTLLTATGREGFKWLGAVTPAGGLCFIAGWILMVIALANKA